VPSIQGEEKKTTEHTERRRKDTEKEMTRMRRSVQFFFRIFPSSFRMFRGFLLFSLHLLRTLLGTESLSRTRSRFGSLCFPIARWGSSHQISEQLSCGSGHPFNCMIERSLISL
jgi:hypothetical protein